MPSRSNKSARASMAVVAGSAPKPAPRVYGTPTGYAPPARVQMGRPQVGAGSRQQMRAAITKDQQAATAGARQFAAQRSMRQRQQNPGQPGVDPVGVNVFNAAKKIKSKQAADKRTIDTMSQ